jgi:hypothetical protein
MRTPVAEDLSVDVDTVIVDVDRPNGGHPMNHLTTYSTTGWPRETGTRHVPEEDRRPHVAPRAREVIRSILDLGRRPRAQEPRT